MQTGFLHSATIFQRLEPITSCNHIVRLHHLAQTRVKTLVPLPHQHHGQEQVLQPMLLTSTIFTMLHPTKISKGTALRDKEAALGSPHAQIGHPQVQSEAETL